MSEQNISKFAILSVILLGILSMILSVFLFSSFFAIVGFSLIFWGALLLYIIPVKSNFTAFLRVSTSVAYSNIERMLAASSTFQKGIYFQLDHGKNETDIITRSEKPKKIGNVIVFVPKNSKISMDNVLEWRLGSDDGIFITPPGTALCKIFEQQMGRSFSKITLKQFISLMPSVLTKGSKLAESVDIVVEGSTVTVTVLKSIFQSTNPDDDTQPLVYSHIGSILSSALACALTMVIGKPVIIENETQDLQLKTIQTTYRLKQ